MRTFCGLLAGLILSLGATCLSAAPLDLSKAVILTRAGDKPSAEAIAPQVLSEEIEKRTGLKLAIKDQWPEQPQAVIALSVKTSLPGWKDQIPGSVLDARVLNRPESFAIHVVPPTDNQPARVFIAAADARGLLFGVGKLLLNLDWRQQALSIDSSFRSELSPNVPLRGHQLGYRARANSWDAWTPEQFDQHIREIVLFGGNAIENIPFEDSDKSPHMKLTREEMNSEMSRICAKYDAEYWVWIPVQFPLPDKAKEDEFLAKQAEFYKSCPRLDAVFVPGGDPGDNEAKNLMPFMQRMGDLLMKHHPKARVWISLQGFRKASVDDFFSYVTEHNPDWLGGAVFGPSSPPLDMTRQRLPARYKLRWYPDITHIVRCQYPIPWLDPAWGLTIGREPVNPRPTDYTEIYRDGYRFTDGFLTYSDGVHDDFNKNLWTQLGWDPNRDPREIAIEYARFFFRPDLAEKGADAIFALETNLRGGLANNSSIDGTLRLWQELETAIGNPAQSWRFEMHLFRAYYDAYTRHRLIYETDLEKQAMTVLSQASKIGVKPALKQAREILNRATTHHVHQPWLDKLFAFAESLFHSIGYQTLMEKYKASGSERGVMMEFVNYPLNSRWWLEDQFDVIEKLDEDPKKQQAKIDEIVNWENPSPGSFYEVIGHISKSPSVHKILMGGDAMRLYYQIPMPDQRWLGEQRRPIRYSWHTYLNYPNAMVYTGLDPNARYTIRLLGQRESPLKVDGTRVKRIRKGETYDEVTDQEFEVPAEAVKDGKIELTWDVLDEKHLNWRQHHYVCEVWVLKHPQGK